MRTDALRYGAPVDWAQGGTPLSDVLGVEFSGVVPGAAYDCGSRSYLRGIVASAVVPQTDSPEQVASAQHGPLRRTTTPTPAAAAPGRT